MVLPPFLTASLFAFYCSTVFRQSKEKNENSSIGRRKFSFALYKSGENGQPAEQDPSAVALSVVSG
jgi:hypothetical protein